MKSHSVVVTAVLTAVLIGASGCSAASGPVAAKPRASSTSPSPTPTPTPTAALGTRSNPFPVGTAGQYDPTSVWTFTGSPTNPDATAEIMAGNEFNEQPTAGTTYVTTKFTIALANTPEVANGADPAGSFRIAYVGTDGNTYEDKQCAVPAPDMRYQSLGTMYGGATAVGSVCAIVPVGAITGGTWSINSQVKQAVAFFAGAGGK